MADDDRWDDTRDPARRGREQHRDEGPYYRERGFSRPPRIGPTGMVPRSGAGDMGTSGRYYEDAAQRAEYGGYGGGESGSGSRRIREGGARGPGLSPGRAYDRDGGYDPPIGYDAADEDAYDRQGRYEGERDGGPYTDYGRAHSGYGAGGGYTPRPSEGVGREGRSWDAAQAEGQHRGRGPKGYTRSDERIREDVSDRLTDDAIVDASEVEVTVSGGEVTLDGTVDSRTAKRRAEDCAEAVMGVGHVQNNLRVRQSPKPGSVGAETDPRVAAVSEGKDADRAARDLAH